MTCKLALVLHVIVEHTVSLGSRLQLEAKQQDATLPATLNGKERDQHERFPTLILVGGGGRGSAVNFDIHRG